MRLIDADALIESLSINPKDCPGCPEPEWLEELADILALAPTVDAIDRQAAIDALADYIHNVDKVMGTGHLTADDCKDAAASVFEELPSAQPTQNERVNSNNPLDCISRQAAIDALGEKPLAWTDGEYELALQQQWESDVDAIKAVPSAQPERKKGKWIPVTNGRGGFECDECHNYAPSFQDGVEWLSDYCPNCGADMRGGAYE